MTRQQEVQATDAAAATAAIDIFLVPSAHPVPVPVSVASDSEWTARLQLKLMLLASKRSRSEPTDLRFELG